MDKKLFVTLNEFDSYCRELAVTISKEYDFDLIVGIVKAGVICGAVLSFIMDKDFYTMKISRREGSRVISRKPYLFVPVTDSVFGKKILLVDEISVTGETLIMAKDHILSKLAKEVKTCAIFKTQGRFSPDWYVVKTSNKIVPPWTK